MQKKDLPNLDLLRSMAVTLVVADHFTKSLGFKNLGSWSLEAIGLFGVYLFFVHTSLVLMWSFERQPNVWDFYIRRAFRIYPLAMVTVLIAAYSHAPVAGIPGNYFHAWNWTTRQLIENLLLGQQALGMHQVIHGVTWSLPPELYMYVLLPCLYFYAKSQRKIGPLLVILALAMALCHRYSPPWMGNTFPILIPDFIPGVIAYVGFMRRRKTIPAWLLPVLIIGLLLANLRLQGFRSDWFACLALGLLLPSFVEIGHPILNLVTKKIAQYSYGVYLIHPFVIVFAVKTLHVAIWLQLLILVICTGALGFLAYHVIELPMMKYGARLAKRLTHERSVPSEESLNNLEPAP